MRIEQSDVHLASRHEADYSQRVTTTETTTFHTVLGQVSPSSPSTEGGARERVAALLRQLVDAILAALAGKNCRTNLADDGHDGRQVLDPEQPQREVTWAWQARETIRDFEHTTFLGDGTVRTADGRHLDFRLQLDCCRDFRGEREFQDHGRIVLHDPLVLNFAGTAADLSGAAVAFDLDGDGQRERIPGLGAGTAYLVFDRNGNGAIDDGRELFGTASGDGFADLAAYDSDRNGWLDEADPGFAALGVWDGKPGDGPQSLAAAGVGALWLGATASPFAIKDGANQVLGEIRAAGLYLHEDGRVGSLQQVDLATTPERGAPAAA